MNELRNLRFFTSGLPLCVVMMSATPSFSQSPQNSIDLPDLYALRLDGGRIRIDVISYGQTTASDFTVRLDSASPDEYRLSIVRHRQDRGRVGAHIVELILEIPTIQNLAQAKFTLANKLATTGDPTDPRALLRSPP
jgi:hypothetical protein